jgi:hypothetical protein
MECNSPGGYGLIAGAYANVIDRAITSIKNGILGRSLGRLNPVLGRGKLIKHASAQDRHLAHCDTSHALRYEHEAARH